MKEKKITKINKVMFYIQNVNNLIKTLTALQNL